MRCVCVCVVGGEKMRTRGTKTVSVLTFQMKRRTGREDLLLVIDTHLMAARRLAGRVFMPSASLGVVRGLPSGVYLATTIVGVYEQKPKFFFSFSPATCVGTNDPPFFLSSGGK